MKIEDGGVPLNKITSCGQPIQNNIKRIAVDNNEEEEVRESGQYYQASKIKCKDDEKELILDDKKYCIKECVNNHYYNS